MTFRMMLCQGPTGRSVYLNDLRIAGPKPWGGGEVIEEWTVRWEDIRRAIENNKREVFDDVQAEGSKMG